MKNSINLKLSLLIHDGSKGQDDQYQFWFYVQILYPYEILNYENIVKITGYIICWFLWFEIYKHIATFISKNLCILRCFSMLSWSIFIIITKCKFFISTFSFKDNILCVKRLLCCFFWYAKWKRHETWIESSFSMSIFPNLVSLKFYGTPSTWWWYVQIQVGHILFKNFLEMTRHVRINFSYFWISTAEKADILIYSS